MGDSMGEALGLVSSIKREKTHKKEFIVKYILHFALML
jgi:hypothetical protein